MQQAADAPCNCAKTAPFSTTAAALLLRLQVDENFQVEEGVQLSDHLTVNKHIGSGSTADVYKLQAAKNDGKQQELVSCLESSSCCATPVSSDWLPTLQTHSVLSVDVDSGGVVTELL